MAIQDYFNIYKGNYNKLKKGNDKDSKEWLNKLTETELNNFKIWLKQNDLKLMGVFENE